MKEYIKIHSDDMVAVALKPLSKGKVVNIDGEDITLLEDIKQGHKFALVDIDANKPIINMVQPLVLQKRI